MFDLKALGVFVWKEGDLQFTSADPKCIYPAIIARIVDCLKGANPSELLATSERGGTARADRLMQNARELPAEAWKDALKPRSEFVAVPYFSLVDRSGRVNTELLALMNKSDRAAAERMINRGRALEIALGWYCHALRLLIGGSNNTITRDDDYRL